MEYGYRRGWILKDVKHGIKTIKWIRDTILAVIMAAKREDLGRKVKVFIDIEVERLKTDPKRVIVTEDSLEKAEKPHKK